MYFDIIQDPLKHIKTNRTSPRQIQYFSRVLIFSQINWSTFGTFQDPADTL